MTIPVQLGLLCACGCSEPVPIAKRTRRGYRKGQPMRFAHGHNTRQQAWPRQVTGVIAGDFRMHSNGYRLLYLPMHPAATKSYVYEHRIIMERKLGRFLASHDHVHHINEDKLDNRPENLDLVTGSRHQVIHRSGITDEQIAVLIADGRSHKAIVALGVSGHRVVRVRRRLQETA